MKWLYTGFFLLSSTLWGQEIGHRFQHDYFQKLSSCGKKTESQLHALRLSLEHKGIKPSRPMVVNVFEQFSGFNQTLFFNSKNWFYPSFNGHHEFQGINCSSGTCRAEFFVFLSDLALSKPDWLYRLAFFDMGDFHAKIAEASLSLHNHFQRSEDMILRDIKVELAPDSLAATVNTKKLQRLMERGYSVLLMWQLKTTMDQQRYDEITKKFESPAELQKLVGGTWRVPRQTSSLSYVGFLVYVTKLDQAYESKVEVRNRRDHFYNCQ
ncbi:MAG: hypothetical protein ACLGG7_12850 [Bacteriovoracia bacterium]